MIIARIALLSIVLGITLSCQSDAGYRHGKVVVVSAPVLSAATASTDGNDHAFIGVTTNTSGGTLFYDGSTNCSANPTAAQVKAGTTPGHVAGTNSSQSVSSSGVQSANPGSLSPVTAYCFYFVQTTSLDSNIASSASFTTNGTLAFSVSRTAAYNANANKTAFDAVVAGINTILTNCLSPPTNITVSENLDYINIGAAAGQTTVARSDNNYATSGAPIRNALIALPGKNSIQTALFANPPASDPTGIGDIYFLTNAQSEAIGLPAFGAPPDFTTTFNSTKTYDTTTGSNCAGVNTCLQSVGLHEFTEGLGRVAGFGEPGGEAGLMELSSYSSAGVRNFAINGLSRFPSSDAGSTNLIGPTFSYIQTGGDPGDWTNSGTDSFTESYSSELSGALTVIDIKALTIVGWPLTHSCRITAGL